MYTRKPSSYSHLKRPLCLLAFLTLWLLLVSYCFPSPKTHLSHTSPPETQTLSDTRKLTTATKKTNLEPPTCDLGVSVYIYDLPPEFNQALLANCRHLNVYTDMCPHVANSGLGQPLTSHPGPTPASWFATHQFIAELLFHWRLLNHPCRTRLPDGAGLFYVPFYAGLYASSKFREPDHTARDALGLRLAEHLLRQPWWHRRRGADHFVAVGRTAWDFMRGSSGPDFGANRFFMLPATKNMSVLTVERNPWEGGNQHGIPYPSYFHPYTSEEVSTWQDRVRRAERRHLFSFIGAPRKGLEKAAIRDEIITQCAESSRCKLVHCGGGNSRCYEPEAVMEVMMASSFCLQAPGDSFTRRSTFDSVLTGCIPVFFSRHTAYTQYAWFLPAEASRYSVFIGGGEEGEGNGRRPRRRIEEELRRIPGERVEEMRRTLVGLIPRLTYAHPNATGHGFKDAVDVALAALASHVDSKVPPASAAV